MTILDKLKSMGFYEHKENGKSQFMVLGDVHLIVGPLGFKVQQLITPDYVIQERFKENDLVNIIYFTEDKIYISVLSGEMPVHDESYFKGISIKKIPEPVFFKWSGV